MGELRALKAISYQSQYHLRPLLLYIFVAAALPHLLEVPTWVAVTLVALVIWAGLVAREIVKPSPALGLGVLCMAFAGVIFWQTGTLLGPDSATPLLLLVAALKLQEIRRLRDAMILLLICALIVMYYLLYSQTIVATIYMIVLVLAIALAFMVIHSPPDRIKEIFQSGPRLVTKDLALALPIFLAFFFLFPRFTAHWGHPISEAKTTIGFSDAFHPGEIAELARSDAPAFRVEFQSQHPAIRDLYWRGLVLDQTDGWSWSRKARHGSEHAKGKSGPVVYDYSLTLEPKFKRNLFVLENTPGLSWTRPSQYNFIVKEDDDIFLSNWPASSKVQYQGWTVSAPERVALTSRDLMRYTQLPADFSPRAQRLAEKLAQNKSSLDEKVNSVLDYYVTQGFQYSLNTPEMRDLDSFLFTMRIGFCEHFASSFAILMRAMGVPARVVVGFQGGEINPYSHHMLVRDSNAHAWAEIYDSNQQMWRREDPTATVASARITMGAIDGGGDGDRGDFARIYYSSLMFWDSINDQYTQFLLNYDFSEQKKLFSWGEGLNIKPYHLYLALAFASLLFVFALSWRLRHESRKRTTPVYRLLQRLLERLRNRKIVLEPDEAPIHFAERAAALWPERSQPILELMAQYILWQYGSRPMTRDDSRKFLRKVRSL